MRKFVITAVSLMALAAPSAAMAGNPHDTDGGYIWNADALATEQGNTVGEWTSQITHNGWWVQDQKGDKGRSEVVQSVHAIDGVGRNK
jgi:hypothetical protein